MLQCLLTLTVADTQRRHQLTALLALFFSVGKSMLLIGPNHDITSDITYDITNDITNNITSDVINDTANDINNFEVCPSVLSGGRN